MPDMFATKRCSSFRNLSSKVDPAQLPRATAESGTVPNARKSPPIHANAERIAET